MYLGEPAGVGPRWAKGFLLHDSQLDEGLRHGLGRRIFVAALLTITAEWGFSDDGGLVGALLITREMLVGEGAGFGVGERRREAKRCLRRGRWRRAVRRRERRSVWVGWAMVSVVAGLGG